MESVALEVSVEGVQGLQLENDAGALQSGKPVPVFGSTPVTGSSLYIGHFELFCKDIETASVTFGWLDKPRVFPDHYCGYPEEPNEADFTIDVEALDTRELDRWIRLGTGVSLLPLHHPIRLAEEYATLDVLSGGRLEYGVGRGFLRYALDVFGIDESESPGRYREAAEIILAAWTAEGPFSYRGEFFDVVDYEFFPKPLQQPHPPIYASAVLTPESFVWTAEKGLHLATACFVPDKEGVQAGIALYRKTLEAAGHDPASRDVADNVRNWPKAAPKNSWFLPI